MNDFGVWLCGEKCSTAIGSVPAFINVYVRGEVEHESMRYSLGVL